MSTSRKLFLFASAVFGLAALATGNYFAFFIFAALSVLFVTYKKLKQKKVKSPLFTVQRNPLNPPLSDEYFALMNYMKAYQKKKDYEKMLSCVDETLLILDRFIKEDKRRYGSFNIQSIPAIEIGGQYWSAFGRLDKLKGLKNVVSKNRNLKDYKAYVDSCFKDAHLAERIKIHMKDHPGRYQNEIGKDLKISGRDVSRIIKTLENIGILRRKKAGKTYRVFQMNQK